MMEFFFYYVNLSDCATWKNIKWGEALTLINQDRMCFEALVIVTSQEDLLNVFFFIPLVLMLHNCQKRPHSSILVRRVSSGEVSDFIIVRRDHSLYILSGFTVSHCVKVSVDKCQCLFM